MTSPITVTRVGAVAPGGDSEREPILYVDLDGCLIRTDLLVESFLVAARRFDTWWRLPLWLLRGKSQLKARLAERAELDPALLPYNAGLIAYLRAERNKGRRIVLATASNRRLAEAVAAYLGCFDAVIASDETNNLRGRHKLSAIGVHLAGEEAFCYAGNDRTDLPIWRAARRAIIVNAPRRVAAAARRGADIELTIEDRPSLAKSLLRAMRPHQWIKNFLVFIPLLASGAFLNVSAWGNALQAFAAFCATSSGIYVLNDLTDLAADRQHPRKRNRPFASGAAPPSIGLGLGVGLVIVGLTLAATTGATVLALLIIYATTSLLYSLYLKEQPLIDVFTLSLLYNIRLFVGGEATHYRISLWLLGFAFFIFLGLALIKRVAELGASDRKSVDKQIPNRGYYPGDTSMLGLMGVGASFTSSIVLALYLQDHAAQAVYANPALLWPLVPLLLFWQCRLWLSTQRGYMLDDPIVYSARDWVSWLVVGIVGLLVVLAHRSDLVLM
jgi:4-hydroxybenzoate polyprenyltransferase/phosphoserine phosphatase